MYSAATPAGLRRSNERAVLRLLRSGRATRAELAKAAGFSQPTAGKIVDGLLAAGVLEEVEEAADAAVASTGDDAAPRLGRPGRALRLDRTRPRFVAVQLGPVHTRLVAAPVGLTDGAAWSHKFRAPATPDAWVAELNRARRGLPRAGLWAVLLSVPGVVDETAGRVLLSPNLHWSETVSLPERCASVFHLPVLTVQEIRALALGHLAANPGADDFLLVDFGSGVGGAAVIGGRLFAGPLGFGGEVGHTPVAGNDRPCGCGATGCVETLVSRRGLLKSFAAAHGGAGRANWRALRDHLALGGPLPRWLTESLDAAAVAIAGAMNVLGLRRLVVTGSLTELPPAVVGHLSAGVARGAVWGRFGQVTCDPAPRRRAAGLIAAAIERLVLPPARATPGGGGQVTKVAQER